MSNKQIVRAHLFISGFVQGVGFRHFVQRNAEKLGIIGWVRNTENGGVEAVAEGEKVRIEEMIKICHKGPWMAKVDKVDVKWQEATREIKDFEVI